MCAEIEGICWLVQTNKHSENIVCVVDVTYASLNVMHVRLGNFQLIIGVLKRTYEGCSNMNATAFITQQLWDGLS